MENAVKSNRMDIRNFQGYKFVCPDKLYPKETCDVRSQYSSTFPFSSNERRSARAKWASHSGRGQDLNPKGPSLFDRSAGLSERSHSFLSEKIARPKR